VSTTLEDARRGFEGLLLYAGVLEKELANCRADLAALREERNTMMDLGVVEACRRVLEHYADRPTKFAIVEPAEVQS
jgi:hypothetical protein